MKIKEFIQSKISKFEYQNKITFFLASAFYVLLTYIFFVNNIGGNDFFFNNLNYLHKLSLNFEKNFEEKNLEINLQNGTFTANLSEPIELPLYDKNLSNKKNILYVSKEAEDKDFNEKDTLIILNKSDLKIYTGQDPVIYSIQNIEQIQNKFNKQTFVDINSKFFPGSDMFNSFGLNLITVLKGVEILFYFIIAFKLVPFLVYGILYLSGYKNIQIKNYEENSFLIFSIFLVLKLPVTTFVYELPIISSILIITVIVSILEKSKLEKN